MSRDEAAFAALRALEINMEEVESSLVARACEQVPLMAPFCLENWSLGLRALSVQTEVRMLNRSEVSALEAFIAATWDHNDPWKNAPYDLVGDLERAIGVVGGRAFVRLGSRSPKDNPCVMGSDFRPVPVYNGRQAMGALGYSERVMMDVGDARRAGVLPAICIRRFIDMEPDYEFRCFVEDGRYSGATQYYLDEGPSSWIRKNAGAIESILKAYVMHAVFPVCDLGSLTCDVILSRDLRPTLLEINPPVSCGRVFPGLFSEHELDGSFLFLGKDQAIKTKMSDDD